VGSLLAEWIGLKTLDFSIITVADDDEIPLGKGGFAEPGPAFISRAVPGFAWGGDEQSLRDISNPEDISRLILFDTWVRNCDRYRPVPKRMNFDNVFFVKADINRPVLTAIDHTHAFTCGREVTRAIRRIDVIQDPVQFGAFPQFSNFRSLAAEAATYARLEEMEIVEAEQLVQLVPSAWLADNETRNAWSEFITRRARFLARPIPPAVPPAGLQ